ncbi:M20 family metallopeptidase [Thermaerobacter sp. PB12/4term]|uniref:M20 family metallopeptidase n=1 Tax=Thermaerobacter sp. PB12/4term TaxID=2293838 RepID=UPI000E328153|nr:ArgE/DapE family deacylase [Thermaerobacter sp. PB12/4term]QIA27268.1 M20 family metallopeptidase [Thermaerobacter sp. PB12/4term]
MQEPPRDEPASSGGPAPAATPARTAAPPRAAAPAAIRALLPRLEGALPRQELVPLAQALIRARTVNPPGGEAQAAAVAVPWLERHGFDVATYEPRPGRTSLIARRQGAEPGPTLLWCGHLDVVEAGDPAAWPHPPFAGVLDGDRIYGRGAVDMKGPVAAALAAAAAIARLGGPRRGQLVLALVADEETMGRHGAGWLARRGLLRADGAIVGEPTRLHLVRAQRGAAWIHLRLHGRPAHAAVPHLGASAVAAAARLVLALEERVWDAFHPLLGPPTASVGRIRGGDSPNRVPERCELVIDRRAVPGETAGSVRQEVEAVVAEVLARHPGVTATITRWQWAEPAETPADAAIVELVRAAGQAVTGQDLPEAGTVAVTDMRYLVAAGIPTVIAGPGRPDLAHAPGEFITVDELAQGALFYAAAFAGWLGVAGSPA